MLYTDDGVHLDRGDVPVTVLSGQTAQVDVALTAGATITTTLTDRATGAPAQGCVQPVDVNLPLPDSGFRQWCTDGSGNTLQIRPVAPGTYQLIADPDLDALGLQRVGATGAPAAAKRPSSSRLRAAPSRPDRRSGSIRAAPSAAGTPTPPQVHRSAATAAAGSPRPTAPTR
ncbi:hypothetical protein OHA72_10965 [Dactylosporangium sp. NBC_01737]|uniref:hypothetical protein n=1 Tax=Dactylosporangium sp. NBC_01737 TaxID=2975959 RepID=UPI002E1646DD|nr:hypothetical protein OHA72_10965 [Dactylosporangium sp. NBC_01737]